MYKHKLGALKRREKLEKDNKEAKDRRSITQFFKLTTETDVLVNIDSSVPVTDYVGISDTDKTNIVSTSNTDSNLRESKQKELKDPGMWSISIMKSVRDMIVSCAPNFRELVDFVKYMPKDINGRSFTTFMLYAKSSNNRESFPRDWLIWSETKQSLHC